MPVAVLEAKKEADDPMKGMQQARRYAAALRIGDSGFRPGAQCARMRG
jgi:type I site-specific restriction endonuclease